MVAATKRLRSLRRLRRKTSASWLPRERFSPADWIGTRVRMSEEFEAGRGRYDLSGRPWLEEICRVCSDPNTRHVRIRASTQVGKTLLLCSMLLYLAENAPASAMVVVPTRDDAVEFRDRLYSLAKESGLTIPPSWRWNTRHVDLGSMRVHLAWPRSPSRMRGKRCKYVFRTEIDVFEQRGKDDPIEATNQRVKGFYRHLILDESTPLPEPSRIDELESDTDQRRWHCRCPECGTYQELRFFVGKNGKGGMGGLRDEHGQWNSPETARREAHYICVKGCKIDNDRKSIMVRNGVWVPKGCRVRGERRAASGEKSSIRRSPLATRHSLAGTPVRDGRSVGFHLWRVHSSATWGDLCADYLTARSNGKLPDFFQNDLGMSYRLRGKMPEWQELGRRMAYTHLRAEVPSDVWFLTAGADVQDDEVYVSVRGWWGECTSALVDWFVFAREPGDDGELVKSDLAQINRYVLNRSWPVVGGTNPRGRSTLRVAMLCCDGNHRTMDVHNWRRALTQRMAARVRIVRGESGIGREAQYKMTTVEHSKRDKTVVYEGGLELWHLNPEVFRVDLAGRFRADPDKPGAWYVTSDAMDVGKFYLRQVVNEPLVLVRGKDGRLRPEWRERDSTLGHDFWDTEVYSRAAAQMIVDGFPGLPGWDASGWPKPAASGERRAASGKRRKEIGAR